MARQTNQFIAPIVFAAGCASLPVGALARSDGIDAHSTIVNCTLTDGTETQCYKIETGHKPDDLEIGPFCPSTIDGEGGIWYLAGENEGLYRINEEFFLMLDEMGYRFYNDDGTVNIADIATAQPEADHACINVSEDPDVELTMLIPVDPVMADTPEALGTVNKIGVALSGVPIFSDAPTIQATNHMPALDLCGGHVDPGGWYHWHATSTDIQSVFDALGVDAVCGQEQDPTAQFGVAFDGYAMLGSQDHDGTTPSDLDECGGHVSILENGAEIYHYHASEEFPNLPSCLVGVQAMNNFETTAEAGFGAQNAGPAGRNEPPRPSDGGGPGQLPPGFEDAAVSLGMTADELMSSLEAAGGPTADLADVAKTLGVDEDALRATLPPPPNQ